MKAKLLALFVALLMVGCGEDAKKETWIENIIATGLSERNDVLIQDGIADYNVYRDGKNDGVCFEYIMTHSEKLDVDELKALLVPLVRTILNEDREGETAFESGIYLRFIYKGKDGRICGDQIITSSDL
jgi:hypothetical protein